MMTVLSTAACVFKAVPLKKLTNKGFPAAAYFKRKWINDYAGKENNVILPIFSQ